MPKYETRPGRTLGEFGARQNGTTDFRVKISASRSTPPRGACRKSSDGKTSRASPADRIRKVVNFSSGDKRNLAKLIGRYVVLFLNEFNLKLARKKTTI